MTAKVVGELMPMEVARRLSGMDYLVGALEGRFPGAPIAKTLGFALVEASEGRAVFEGRAHTGVYNPQGVAHGGWFGVLLDSCMSCAVMSRLPAGKGQTTIEYKINTMRPATEASGLLRAVGEVTHLGRRTAVAQGGVTDGDGRLYATGMTTMMLLDL